MNEVMQQAFEQMKNAAPQETVTEQQSAENVGTITEQIEANASTETPDVISDNQQQSEQNNNTSQEQVAGIPNVEQEIDYSVILGNLTKGEISSLEQFNELREKAKTNEELNSRLALAEQKLVDVYPNEYVKTLSQLYKDGASTEQIALFQKINALGDLSKLSDQDAMVYQLVQEGWNESVARDKVEMEFDLSGLDEESKEYRVAKQQMELAANKSRQALQQQVVDITTSVSEKQQATKLEQEKQEQDRLEGIAKQAQYAKQVSKASNELSKSITGLGEITIREEKDKAPIKITENYPEEFAKHIPKLLELHLLENGGDLNEDALESARQYVNSVYWAQNGEAIVKKAVDHAIALERQSVTNEFENRSGLQKPEPKPVSGDSSKQYSQFLSRVAVGE